MALAVAATGRFPVKAVAKALGVARSNLVEQLRHPERRRRGPYRREGDDEFLAEIRAVTDARPTYGYRRVAALLNRARRSCGEPQVNLKRVFRLMRLGSLLLQPCTGRRAGRAHDGTVVAPASNRRWASDGFEVPCWNGEVVRVAFAIDTHDREVMAWVATAGAGISGEVVRDMMLECVERRFDAVRAPEPVQWLADNGSAYTAGETVDFATALNLVACFTPVRGPRAAPQPPQQAQQWQVSRCFHPQNLSSRLRKLLCAINVGSPGSVSTRAKPDGRAGLSGVT